MSNMLQAIKNCIKDELETQADKEIECLVNDFRDRLNIRKAELVGAIVNSIEVLSSHDNMNNVTVFQINIRSSGHDTRKSD